MKRSEPVKLLLELEEHYNRMLSGIRALIAAERGQPIEQQSTNGATSAMPPPFAKLKKADAAAEIFKQRGNMSALKLFKALKKKGHPVKSRNSIATMLSTNDRFERKGKASWGLVGVST
jgi:hypothetical protein